MATARKVCAFVFALLGCFWMLNALFFPKDSHFGRLWFLMPIPPICAGVLMFVVYPKRNSPSKGTAMLLAKLYGALLTVFLLLYCLEAFAGPI